MALRARALQSRGSSFAPAGDGPGSVRASGQRVYLSGAPERRAASRRYRMPLFETRRTYVLAWDEPTADRRSPARGPPAPTERARHPSAYNPGRDGRKPRHGPPTTKEHHQAPRPLAVPPGLPALRTHPQHARTEIAADLAQWVFNEYGISVTKQILSRELRALGYRKLSARPRHHEHSEAVVEAFKKKSPMSSRISRRPPASRSNCGSKTKPASVKRTRSRDAGPHAERDPLP